MGVSTLGVSALATARYPQKYPQHLLAGKARCNRIKVLRLRTFDTEKLNRTVARSPDSKLQTRVRLPAPQWCCRL
jgi:hypothetical protein